MTKQNFVIRAFQLSLPELNYGTQSFLISLFANRIPNRQSSIQIKISFIFVKQPEITFHLTLFGF